jgi:hypothetical protein
MRQSTLKAMKGDGAVTAMVRILAGAAIAAIAGGSWRRRAADIAQTHHILRQRAGVRRRGSGLATDCV